MDRVGSARRLPSAPTGVAGGSAHPAARSRGRGADAVAGPGCRLARCRRPRLVPAREERRTGGAHRPLSARRGRRDRRRAAHLSRRRKGVPVTRIGGTWQNWGRSASVKPVRVERPRTPEGVQRAVVAAASQGLTIKAVGAGHSFTGIAVAPGVLLELDDLQGLISADAVTGRATFLAGTRLHRIPGLLAPYGLAMQNLGDIDRQSISGAISTGTHGTGAGFGGLATQVVGITVVTAAGEF